MMKGSEDPPQRSGRRETLDPRGSARKRATARETDETRVLVVEKVEGGTSRSGRIFSREAPVSRKTSRRTCDSPNEVAIADAIDDGTEGKRVRESHAKR